MARRKYVRPPKGKRYTPKKSVRLAQAAAAAAAAAPLEPPPKIETAEEDEDFKLSQGIAPPIQYIINDKGEASVIEQFLINEGRKKIPVAGCRCVKGVLKKNALFRVMRKKQCVFDGRLDSMRHMKEEVETIKTGMECGLRLSDPNIQFRPGDTIVCYVRQTKQANVNEWKPKIEK